MKITVGTVEPHRDIAAGQEFLNVPWTLFNDDGSIASEGAQAFPLDASLKEVEDFLNRKILTYKENLALSQEAQEQKIKVDNATEVAGQITGITVSEQVSGDDTINQRI